MREGVRGRSGLGCANDCEPLAPARPSRVPSLPPNQTRYSSLVAASPDPAPEAQITATPRARP